MMDESDGSEQELYSPSDASESSQEDLEAVPSTFTSHLARYVKKQVATTLTSSASVVISPAGNASSSSYHHSGSLPPPSTRSSSQHHHHHHHVALHRSGHGLDYDGLERSIIDRSSSSSSSSSSEQPVLLVPYPSTSSSFYSGRLSPRFSLPAPSLANYAPVPFAANLSVSTKNQQPPPSWEKVKDKVKKRAKQKSKEKEKSADSLELKDKADSKEKEKEKEREKEREKEKEREREREREKEREKEKEKEKPEVRVEGKEMKATEKAKRWRKNSTSMRTRPLHIEGLHKSLYRSMEMSISSPGREDSVIRLNIGGVRYTTTKATLMRIPNTFFSVLLSGKFPALKDQTGAYFIDRDGKLFEPILSFLRTNHLKIPEGHNLEAILNEMEFYGMTELSEHISSRKVCDHPGYKYFVAQLSRADNLVNIKHTNKDKQEQEDKVEEEDQRLSPTHAHTKVTHLCSKFNIVCAAYEDGSIACWKFESMALGWRMMFMSPQCLPSADGIVMSATMTTTGQYTNLYLAVYSRKTARVCVWDQLHTKACVKWGILQLDMVDIISCNFMVNNCYLVSISSNNSICIFDLREPPERNKIIYMCAPSHATASSTAVGPSSPRAPRELSARSMELNKKQHVMCVAVVDPFSFLGFDDGTVCELAQHFNSHTHWEWVIAETWEDIDREVITCLSCVVFTDRHGSNVLLTYGTEEGSVRLCSKVVNTRNFKLIYSAKGHHDQPITQVMISESHKSGGGLIFSSLSLGGCIKTWRYLYVDLPQPHVSCIACCSSGGGIDRFIFSDDLLTQMVFLERNLENAEGKEIEGRVEAHLCMITNGDKSSTLFDDYSTVCTIKPVDRSSITSCCVVSYDDITSPKPYVRNQFVTGHENGTLQIWDLDLAFQQSKIMSRPTHSLYPFATVYHHSHGGSYPLCKTTLK